MGKQPQVKPDLSVFPIGRSGVTPFNILHESVQTEQDLQTKEWNMALLRASIVSLDEVRAKMDMPPMGRLRESITSDTPYLKKAADDLCEEYGTTELEEALDRAYKQVRSEERRVGEQCRYRLSAY